jgi:Protein of unknown function (DUF3570)
MTTTTAAANDLGVAGPAAQLVAALLFVVGCAASPPQGRASSPGDTIVRSGVETSVYADSDDVTVVTPTISAAVEGPLSGWSVHARYLVDVVTAASVDIVATATPAWSEVRHGISGDAGYKPGDLGAAIQASASIEPDYRSLSVGGTGAWDLHEKNVTLLAGYGYTNDTVGREETPFDVFGRTFDRHTVNGGVSVVVGPATLVTAVVDAMVERGDQSKPYRYVPMFQPGASDDIPVGASYAFVAGQRVDERPLERLPLSRERYALTGRLAHRFAGSTLRLEERLYLDTWGLLASTSDARYIVDIGRRLALGPHVRFHAQGAVDFWRRAYELEVDAEGRLVPPEIRTGDRELGPLRTFTGGLGAQCDLSMSAGARSWVLALQADGVFTEYVDALYVARRNAIFTAISLDATFD